MNIRNHANHADFSACHERDASNRVFTLPETERRFSVNDDHPLALRAILPAKVTPLAQVHAHGVEVARRHHVCESPRKISFSIVLAFGLQTPASVPT